MKTIFSTKIFIISAVLLSVVSFLVLNAAQSDPEYADSFKVVENPKALIDSEFEKAKAENKKLVFVLGGNWCHDSRSLARKLDEATLSQTVEKNYRVSMVDVGFLNQGFEFTERADMSTYYATPTVLIFDPITGKQLNAEDMHIWANADSVSQEDTQAYFEKYSQSLIAKTHDNLSKAQQLKLTELEQFISAQELRIIASYKVTGPMLERYKNDDEDENFDSYWKALANLRMSLPKDTSEIRAQIIAASDSELAAIEFPEYGILPWE